MITGRSTDQTPSTHPTAEDWNPHLGTRIGPAWDRIAEHLRDGRWHPWAEVVDSVVPESGLLEKSVHSLLYAGIRHGYLVRKGQYRRRTSTDNRSVRLIREPNQ